MLSTCPDDRRFVVFFVAAVRGRNKGTTICHTDEIVQSNFLDGNLIERYINKMGTNGGGGVVDGVALRGLQAILVPG